MSRLTRDGTTAEPVSRDQILRRERGQGNINFPCSADHVVQDWRPYPFDSYSAICVTIHSKSKDQPGKAVNPARGQLNNREKVNTSLFTFAPENLVSRDGFGSPVPRQPAHLHTKIPPKHNISIFPPPVWPGDAPKV